MRDRIQVKRGFIERSFVTRYTTGQHGIRLLLTFAIAGLIILASPLRAQFVYVTNALDGTVSAYSLSANGGLTPVVGSPFTVGNTPNLLAIHPNGKTLYVANLFSRSEAYEIDQNGALTLVPGSDATGAAGVAVEPRGKFVYLAEGIANGVSAYGLGKKGALTPLGPKVFTGVYPASVTVGPSSEYVYVPNAGTNNLSVFRIDSSGNLTPGPGSPFQTEGSARAVAVDSKGKYVYVVNQDAGINIYSIGCEGGLTPLPGSPFYFSILGSGAFGLALDPKGEFAYMVTAFSDSIVEFRIGDDGTLTPVTSTSLPAKSWPFTVAVDSNGGFLYTANFKSNNVSGYSIGDDGTLTAVPGSPFAAGSNPAGIAITPVTRPGAKSR